MIRIDARGLKCPWPAIRLARALRDGCTDIIISADDPNAPTELAATARSAGARLVVIAADNPNEFRVTK